MTHTVLVVDDDAAVLDVIASMLEDIGCNVVCAHSGDEALETLTRHQNISILITDINMPAHSSDAQSSSAIRRERRRDGFPMLRKPFSEEDLARVMQQTTGVC
jgi:two-component system, cell cycle response regulator CpdR